ncbi:unnamed protein product [Echinostoma caproni]|uniref:RRM domain-containing protein n=1 Tax=Echinostoma caproni TaxID=27848 RepID=A0A183B5Y0_9TREM|nr:unnamed protein product [Echinostoma caproni]
MSAVIRIRGLPYSARADDIIDFFKVFQSSKQEMNSAMGRNQNSFNRREYVVRLRGLPYDTEKKEIYAFFNGLEIAPNGIGLLVDHMGRCTGEAYVQFTSAEMLARAKEKHMEKIGHRWLFPGNLTGGLGIRVCFHLIKQANACIVNRLFFFKFTPSSPLCSSHFVPLNADSRRYIEIFESSMMEANATIQRQMEANQSRSGGGPITSRGARDGYPGGYYGAPKGSYGPPPGMGPAYGRGPPPGRPGPYARPPASGHPGYNSPRGMNGPYGMSGGSDAGFGPMSNPEPEDPQSVTGHSVRMRGLPFSATTDDIDRFLAPLQPVNIRIRMNSSGRPTGEAVVDFASHDEAKEAMKKDREKIGSRYIELFLASTPMGNGPSRMVCSFRNYSLLQGGGPSPYSGGPRSYGPPGTPPYNSVGRGPINDPYNGDYGLRGPEDMGYGPMYGGDYGPDGYYSSANSMRPMGPSGDGYADYRPPYRHW